MSSTPYSARPPSNTPTPTYHPYRRYPHHQQQQQGTPYNLYIQQGQFTEKRARKAIQRRTVDYNAIVVRHLELRSFQRNWKDYVALQPDPNFIVDLLPPFCYPHNPSTSVVTKFVHTSTNKIRCPINAVRWTPEGRRLITGASSGEFTLWNGLTFNFETILQAHDKAVRCMRWSHNDTWLITGDDSGIIKYWQSNMNNLKVVVAHKETVRDLSFSPTDAKYASCSDDGTIKIWGFAEGNEERVLTGHGWDVKCIDWHPSKSLLASGSKDNLVKLWDPKTGKALSTLHGHKNTILGIEWNKNGNWLVTASRDQLLRVYDIRTMREVQGFRGHKKDVQSVAWHPHHETLFASGGSDGSIMFWNVGTDHATGGLDGAHESSVFALDWHPVGHILVSGSNDHTTRFWTRNRPGDTMAERFGVGRVDNDGGEEEGSEEEGSEWGGGGGGGGGGVLPGLGDGGIPGVGGGIPGVGGRFGRDEDEERRVSSLGTPGYGRGRGADIQMQSQETPMGRQQRYTHQQQSTPTPGMYQPRPQQQQPQQQSYVPPSFPQQQQRMYTGTHTPPQRVYTPPQQPPQQPPQNQAQQILSQLAAQGFPLNAGLVSALTRGQRGQNQGQGTGR